MNEIKFLNDVEKEAIMSFNSNQTLKGAVKKILLSYIYNQGTLVEGEPADWRKNFMLKVVSDHVQGGISDNNLIGQDLRAIFEACNLLESGFGEIEKFVLPAEPKAKKQNPGS